MATRNYIVRFYYEEQARRAAELPVNVDESADDPTDGLTERYIHELHKEVVKAVPYMEFIEDEETDNVVSFSLEDPTTGECFDRELEVNSPRAWRESLSNPTYGAREPAAKIDPLAELLKQLSWSPVFAMSQGSRELFHSNVLAWLLRTRREKFLRTLLEKLGIDSEIAAVGEVSREWKSFDLTIEIKPKTFLVIENKFKSTPGLAQLNEYAEEVERFRRKGFTIYLVLLAPDRPTSNRTGLGLIDDNTWRFLSYADLSVLIDALAEKESDYYMHRLMKEYVAVVWLLLSVKKHLSIDPTKSFLPGKEYKLLKASKLHDLAYKWRYEELAQSVEALLGERLYEGEFLAEDTRRGLQDKIEVNVGFSNGTALMELKTLAPGLPKRRARGSEKKAKAAIIGVQLQHCSLRLFMEHVSKGIAEQVLRSTNVEVILSSLSPEFNVINRQRDPNGLNKYGDWFHYRYVDVEGGTFEGLARKLVDIEDSLKQAVLSLKIGDGGKTAV